MDIQVDRTEKFDKEFDKLGPSVRQEVTQKMNALILKLQESPRIHRQLYRPRTKIFPRGFDQKNSTLYLYRINNVYRVILTFDHDPLYDQYVLTLYEIMRKSEIGDDYNRLAAQMYERWQK